MASKHVLPDEAYVTEVYRRRFQERRNLNGPMHPYDSSLGRCHIWTARRDSRGYGVMRVWHTETKATKTMFAHRLAKALAGAPIGVGYVSRHSCDNPSCCNADHILSGSQSDNMKDMDNRGRRAPLPSNTGASHPRAILNCDLVQQIRNHNGPARVLAEKIGVSVSNINYVRRGATWNDNKIPMTGRGMEKGSDRWNAKLVEADIVAIRNDTRSNSAIASDYNIGRAYVGRIKARKVWRHLT